MNILSGMKNLKKKKGWKRGKCLEKGDRGVKGVIEGVRKRENGKEDMVKKYWGQEDF